MRITFMVPGIYGGVCGGSRVIITYAQKLQDLGHDVRFLGGRRSPPVPWRTTLRTLVRERRWPERRRRSSGPGPLLEHLSVPILDVPLTRPVRDDDVPDGDVVIAAFWKYAEDVYRLGPSKGAKVYLVQDYTLACPGLHVHPQYAERVAASWRLPMHKIVVSEFLASICADEYGDASYSLVPNAADLELFDAEPRGKQRVPTVGCMYSLEWIKGIDIAVAALNTVRRSRPDLRTRWFGTQKVDASLPLPPGSDYLRNPPQEGLKDVYGACDAWLFPSRNDGFGLPIVEAMACRTPVIATPAGAAPELLADGGGMLVDYDNPDAMAEAILRVVDLSDESWRLMSDRARKTVERYTWDDAALLFEHALRQAIARSSGV